MAGFSQKRRRFLRALIVAGAGLWAVKKFFTLPHGDKKLLVRVADDQIPERGALVYRQHRFALIREQGQVYALSLICTHLGCTLNVTSQQLTCPCHGSIFDRHGQVIKGPADKPLPRLSLRRQRNEWLVYS